MKKILLALIALIALLTLMACGKTWTSTVTDFSGEVSSNGGFLVEKGDYVYYINGKEVNTADNAFGTPIKGAIVRTKKADIGKADAEAEMVVPEVVYSDTTSQDSGLFIFGDYIYYTTPCSEQNKNGEVRNGELEFMRTKLDGSESKVIATVASLSPAYRFSKVGDTVYLVVYTTNDDGDNVLKTYNAETQELLKESKKVSSYAFSTDLNDEYVYYTTPIHNEELDEDETFNSVQRFAVDGSEDIEVLNGAGTYSDETHGVAIAGVSFTIEKYTGAQLYLKEALVQTSTISVYKGVNTADFVTEKQGETPATKVNYDKLEVIDDGSSFASTIFTTSTIYINLNNIVYFDSTYGICKYDYSKANDPQGFGREIVYYNKDMLSWSLKYIDDGMAYFTDSDNIYHSFALGDVIDLESGEIKTADVKPVRLNYYEINTSWYNPEFVGDYMITAVSTEPYYDYIYAIDLSKTKDMTEDQLKDYEEDLKTVDREHILARTATRLGKLSDADETVFKTFMDENYPEKQESSDSSSSSN